MDIVYFDNFIYHLCLSGFIKENNIKYQLIAGIWTALCRLRQENGASESHMYVHFCKLLPLRFESESHYISTVLTN